MTHSLSLWSLYTADYTHFWFLIFVVAFYKIEITASCHALSITYKKVLFIFSTMLTRIIRAACTHYALHTLAHSTDIANM